MAIGVTDLNRLAAAQHVPNVYLDVWPQTAVATALINQTSFGYPLGELTVDNTSNWSAIEVGMRVVITDPSSGDHVMSGVVRKAPTSSGSSSSDRPSGWPTSTALRTWSRPRSTGMS